MRWWLLLLRLLKWDELLVLLALLLLLVCLDWLRPVRLPVLMLSGRQLLMKWRGLRPMYWLR